MVWPFSSSSKQDSPSASASASSSSSAPSQPSADVGPSQPAVSSSTTTTPSTYATDSDPTTYLRTHSFSQPAQDPAAPSTATYVPTASSLLSDPSFDPSVLHPLAGLGKDELEYLDITDNQPSTLEGARTALPSRGWSDDLCYGTGTTYLSGLMIGGMLGAKEGLSRPLGIDNPTFRLRLNAVLNQVTRRGSFFGNSAGVVALIYNLVDASIDAARGKHDMAGAVLAGGISGAMFKCTAGPRPMMIASGIMMAAAATWTTAKKALI
ncbi:Tim17-domain-containing protein [Violaceomyces palustris]|uniref:Tim17-domain-containing protein n=1 Tax=Violaceomyces palustris TaxID=1673888 RepID=A0ACD0NY23_9BASI|nr:Tim17-domain-containing protein [Violaceomyces palustris]